MLGRKSCLSVKPYTLNLTYCSVSGPPFRMNLGNFILIDIYVCMAWLDALVNYLSWSVNFHIAGKDILKEVYNL